MNAPIRFELNGRAADALPGESLLQAAQRAGVAIPHLCFKQGLAAAGNCRACMVEIDGERTLAPACCRGPTEGMKVRSDSPRALKSQQLVLELLLADMPAEALTRDDELRHWAEALAIGAPRFAARETTIEADLTHPAIAVRLDACIQCTRCQRACRDVQVNDVIGLAHRGAAASIVFDIADPMGERGWYAIDRIGNYSALLFHGDQVRGGFAGCPWYGFRKRVQG